MPEFSDFVDRVALIMRCFEELAKLNDDIDTEMKFFDIRDGFVEVCKMIV